MLKLTGGRGVQEGMALQQAQCSIWSEWQRQRREAAVAAAGGRGRAGAARHGRQDNAAAYLSLSSRPQVGPGLGFGASA